MIKAFKLGKRVYFFNRNRRAQRGRITDKFIEQGRGLMYRLATDEETVFMPESRVFPSLLGLILDLLKDLR